jgi:hypothetical protein
METLQPDLIHAAGMQTLKFKIIRVVKRNNKKCPQKFLTYKIL